MSFNTYKYQFNVCFITYKLYFGNLGFLGSDNNKKQ